MTHKEVMPKETEQKHTNLLWYARWNPLKGQRKADKELHSKPDSLEESLVALFLSFKGTDVGFKRECERKREREREMRGSMQMLASQIRPDYQEWAQKYIKKLFYLFIHT